MPIPAAVKAAQMTPGRYVFKCNRSMFFFETRPDWTIYQLNVETMEAEGPPLDADGWTENPKHLASLKVYRITEL